MVEARGVESVMSLRAIVPQVGIYRVKNDTRRKSHVDVLRALSLEIVSCSVIQEAGSPNPLIPMPRGQS